MALSQHMFQLNSSCQQSLHLEVRDTLDGRVEKLILRVIEISSSAPSPERNPVNARKSFACDGFRCYPDLLLFGKQNGGNALLLPGFIFLMGTAVESL